MLQAIGELCTHSGGVVQRGGERAIVTAVLGAAQRKKAKFREAALICLEKVKIATPLVIFGVFFMSYFLS